MHVWQFQRHCLNHDWFQHSLLTSLDDWLSRWGMENADLLFLRSEAHCLPEFCNAKDLIESYSTIMSPAALFEYDPMNQDQLDRIMWLKDIAHHWWFRSNHIEKLQNEALEALKKAKTAYGALTQARASGCLTTTHIQDFRDTINALSSTVINLPCEEI